MQPAATRPLVVRGDRPSPASDADLSAVLLTVDVAVGTIVFRKGTPLLWMVAQHRHLFGQVYQSQERST